MGLDSFSFFLLLTIGGFLRIRTFPVSGLRSVCTLRGCGGGEEYCLILEVVGVYVGVVIGSVGFIREGGRCGEY